MVKLVDYMKYMFSALWNIYLDLCFLRVGLCNQFQNKNTNGKKYDRVLISLKRFKDKGNVSVEQKSNIIILQKLPVQFFYLEFREYNIYSLTKKIRKMSYLSMIPTYYPNNSFSYPQSSFIQQNTFNNANFLIILSSALKTSLNSYAIHFQQSAQNKPQQLVSKPQIIQISDCEKNSQEFVSSHENNNNLNTVVAKQAQQKNIEAKMYINSETQIQKDLPISTDDQLIVEEKEMKIKKAISKGSKNKPSKQRENKFYVAVPEVDLIDSAYIPAMKSDYNDLCKKKQALLKRRVLNWAQFTKPKKDKRQIRMLIN